MLSLKIIKNNFLIIFCFKVQKPSIKLTSKNKFKNSISSIQKLLKHSSLTKHVYFFGTTILFENSNNFLKCIIIILYIMYIRRVMHTKAYYVCNVRLRHVLLHSQEHLDVNLITMLSLFI